MSVKRFYADTLVGETKKCVLASDYDALVSVCRELIGNGPKHMFHDEDDIIFQEAKRKALALLDGEKNEGVRA